jgi:nucleoside-triphosphatase THEP1
VSDKTTPSATRRLLRSFERFRVIISIVLCVLLTVAYFAIPKIEPQGDSEAPPHHWTQTMVSYVQDVTANTIPVFLLFVLSVWLLREVFEVQREQASAALVEDFIRAMEGESGRPKLDAIYQRRTAEEPLVSAAEKDLLIVQETGSLLTERCKLPLVSFLKRGGSVKLVVVETASAAGGLLAYRNANLKPDAIRRRALQFSAHIDDILGGVGVDAERFETRYLPYPVCSTSVTIDPNDERPGRAISLVRSAGFRVPFDDKLDVMVERTRSPVTFDHYRREFTNLFLAGSKILLLTGAPKSGKTSLVEELLRRHSSHPNIFWCLSRERLNSNGDRAGFEVTFTGQATGKVFATKNADGAYDIDIEIWDDIADRVTAAANSHNMLIIDEIGPIQLASTKFKAAVKAVIDNTSSTLVASIASDALGEDFIAWCKHHHRSSVMRLQRGVNFESHLTTLDLEVTTSLNHVRPEI